MFTLFPAIDLKDGACVRLRRGDMSEATVYGSDAAAQALTWQEAGAEWLHVVDLNGAFAGRAVNASAVEAILQVVSVPVQLGGGIRSMGAIDAWLTAGVTRVILGSAAVKSPNLMAEAARVFPGRIAVGIDARNGRVATDGWVETTSVSALELARRAEGAGIAALIYTDIARDGMLSGVNIPETLAIARAVSVPVIASGGIGSDADLQTLAAAAGAETIGRLTGVIVGRALYDGRVDLRAALRMLRSDGGARRP